ncbi:MAG: endonuclease MutS2 [Flammeovirgaceae bacterium]|nr:endonuclease MutS2 [Flammeovirgaceae bacterium]
MIYPQDFESRIGFDLIRSSLQKYCSSTLGQKEVERIGFSTDSAIINEKLDQTTEFIRLMQSADPPQVSGFYDPHEIWPILRIEDSYLEEDLLFALFQTLEKAQLLFNFLNKRKEECPSLLLLTIEISWPNELLRELINIFTESGKLADQASRELARIRKRLTDEQAKVRGLVNKIFRDASNSGFTPDGSSPTLRNGRVVLPIKSEHKRKIKGFVHDESATGQTIFIEPSELLELNNEIRDIEIEERKEVVKILRSITNELRNNSAEVKQVFNFLSRIDCIRAKAKLAIQLSCVKPLIVNGPNLRWKNAKHPILMMTHKKGNQVVPLTIDLDANDRLLLVSGPNAGGKSVCLKTVGLIQYMFQCGLPVPVHESSTLGMFDSIFLDIGDQQSIENDLSTYSSHLASMNHFIRKADDHTMILIDEMGSGTDPSFGGGIAEAIIKKLLEKGAWGVITTHYYNLKMFAAENSGMRNAAMRFDTKQLQPLFELEIGPPGNSFALEIAKKIGLSKDTLDEAEKCIGKELVGLETIMQNLMHEKQEVEKKLEQLTKKEELLERSKNEYDQLKSNLEHQKKEIIQKAKLEASMLLDNTNKQIEKTIRHIKESKAEKKETRKVRDGLSRLKQYVKTEKSPVHKSGVQVKVNDHVRIIGQEVSGTVQAIKGKSAVVAFGDLRTTVKMDQLVLSREVSSESKAGSLGINLHVRRSAFNDLIDVRGKKAEDVILLVRDYIDEATLLNYPQVKILHGKGEGILRKVIREQLKTNKSVQSCKDEHIERGGEGITVVDLK